MFALLRSILIYGRDLFKKMVELMLNTYVCSILFYSRDVSKFVCFIPQLRFLNNCKIMQCKRSSHKQYQEPNK